MCSSMMDALMHRLHSCFMSILDFCAHKERGKTPHEFKKKGYRLLPWTLYIYIYMLELIKMKALLHNLQQPPSLTLPMFL